jgi:ketosteroid isomerase-like protein
MRRFSVASLVLLLVASSARGTRAQVAEDDQGIRAFFEIWRRASERADPQGIDRLLAPGAQLTRPGGVLETYEATMRNVRRDSAAISKSGRSDGRQNEISYTDFVVRHYGDLAVVTYHSHYKSLLRPDFGESDYEVMRVLVKRDGPWRIVAGHGVFMPRPCPDSKSP